MKQHIPFMRWKWFFISVSLLFVAGSFFIILTKGLNFGVDFKGGIKLAYHFSKPIGDGDIRKMLDSLDLGDVQVIRFGKETENSYMIKTKYQEGIDVTKAITAEFKKGLGDDGATLLSEENVGPKVGRELRKRGLFAIILTWILILIYVGIRFDFLFSPGAIVALIHDVVIAVGFFAFFDKEVNLPILAAVLTIIGYSINDTIVIYDRVRENLRKLPSSMPLAELIEQSINETLSRTIITSLTVLFAVLVLFFLGGGVLHDFAFCMVVGVIAGTYSTIFVASPVYLLCQRLFPHKGLVRTVGKR